MAEFKFTISNPQTKRSYQKAVDQGQAAGIIGKKIGEEFPGDSFGLAGYIFKITGGTDRDGFPMYPSVKGPVKKRILLIGSPGFHPKMKGQRRRKMVRGDTISTDIVQINVKIMKKGEKPLEEMFPTKPKEKKEEKSEPVKEEKQAKPEEKTLEERKAEENKLEEKKAS